jgi:oligopeptide transport system substrate-binding protein
MTKSSWRLLMSLFALFAVMSIAVACGDDDDDTSGTAGPAGTTAPGTTTAATKGGTVTIQAAQFESWDPHFANFAQDITHMMMVRRGLYHLDLQDKPIPAMATGAPTVSADGKTYTIKIQSGLKWSDGQPLDANDFVLGIQRTCNPDIAGAYQYILTAVVGCDDYYAATDKTAAEKDALLKGLGVRAVDASTLEIKLTTAQPTFPIILSMWPTFPAPKHQIKAVADKYPDAMTSAVNGPFMVKAYTEKASMELVPNPNWAGKDKPNLDKIVLKYIDDPAVANQAYRANELDAALANKAELDKLKTEFPKELNLYPGTRTTALQFNWTNPILAKADVRRAFSQATDRVTLVKVVYKDANIPTTSWLPPVRNGLKGGEYDSLLGFDATKAKASLKAAGYDNGAGFPKLTILVSDSATNKLLSEFLQAEWKKHLNVEVGIEVVDSKTRSARYNSKNFEIFIGGWQEDYPDPENWIIGLKTTGAPNNKQSISIKAVDDLAKLAQFNTNDEQRRQQYRDIEKALATEAAEPPMFHTVVAMLVKPTIKGMVENKRPGDTFVPGDWYPELWSTTKK